MVANSCRGSPRVFHSIVDRNEFYSLYPVFDGIEGIWRYSKFDPSVFTWLHEDIAIQLNTVKYYVGTRLKDILNSLKDFIPPSLPRQLLNDLWESFVNMSTLSLVFFLLLHRFGKLPRPYFWQNSAESALRVVRKLWRPGHHSCQGNWRIRVGLSRRRRVCLLRPVPFLI